MKPVDHDVGLGAGAHYSKAIWLGAPHLSQERHAVGSRRAVAVVVGGRVERLVCEHDHRAAVGILHGKDFDFRVKDEFRGAVDL